MQRALPLTVGHDKSVVWEHKAVNVSQSVSWTCRPSRSLQRLSKSGTFHFHSHNAGLFFSSLLWLTGYFVALRIKLSYFSYSRCMIDCNVAAVVMRQACRYGLVSLSERDSGSEGGQVLAAHLWQQEVRQNKNSLTSLSSGDVSHQRSLGLKEPRPRPPSHDYQLCNWESCQVAMMKPKQIAVTPQARFTTFTRSFGITSRGASCDGFFNNSKSIGLEKYVQVMYFQLSSPESCFKTLVHKAILASLKFIFMDNYVSKWFRGT